MTRGKQGHPSLLRGVVMSAPRQTNEGEHSPAVYALTLDVYEVAGRSEELTAYTVRIPEGLLWKRGELFMPGHRLFIQGAITPGERVVWAEDAWFDRGQGL